MRQEDVSEEDYEPSIAPAEDPGTGKEAENQQLLEGAAGIEVPAHVGKHEAKTLKRLYARTLDIPARRIWLVT